MPIQNRQKNLFAYKILLLIIPANEDMRKDAKSDILCHYRIDVFFQQLQTITTGNPRTNASSNPGSRHTDVIAHQHPKADRHGHTGTCFI